MIFERELVLSATKKSWKMSSTHGTEYSKEYKRNKNTWNSVWERDEHKCYYCGFTSKKYQEIHHLDDNHSNNSEDNLVTVCPLCHYSHHLDIASLSGGASIIWLPDLSQQELNHLARLIMVGREYEAKCERDEIEVPDYIRMLRTIEGAFTDRKSVVEKYFPDASDPATFSTVLMNFDEDKYNNRATTLQPFKLFLTNSSFPRQARYWLENTYSNMAPNEWEKLIKRDIVEGI